MVPLAVAYSLMTTLYMAVVTEWTTPVKAALRVVWLVRTGKAARVVAQPLLDRRAPQAGHAW
jgi:hypothetical protein